MQQQKRSFPNRHSSASSTLALLRSAATVGAITLALGSALARADDEPALQEPTPAPKLLSKWSIDVDHPDRAIPSEADRNADPIQFGYWLQDLVAKATAAALKGDHATAARLYEALGQAVPDRAVGLSKACDEYEALGDRDKAINACGGALLGDGLRVVDYTHFVGLVLGKPGDLSPRDEGALAKVIDHMREDPAGRELAPDVECQVGTRMSNVAQLEECTAELSARAPNDVKTVTYEWALAVAKGQFDDARAIGERARAAGVPAENLEAMDRMTAARERRRRWERFFAALGGAILLAAIGLGVRFWRRWLVSSGGASTPAAQV
jgi:hypothetical protein